MEIIQKIRLGNSVPAIAAGALFYGDEQLCGEEHIPVPPTPDYSTMYFTLESLEDGNTISLTAFAAYASAPENTFYYSTDNGSTWTSVNSNTSWSGLNTGSKIMIKCTTSYFSYDGNRYWYFSSTKSFNVYGNIMSLLYGDNFIGQTTIPGGIFSNLFKNATELIDASNLILPATTLTRSCYIHMFDGCTSLTTAPALPATTLEVSCYSQMFYGCTSLTTAPDLPAPTLTNNCYYEMFRDCTSLNYVKCLATNKSASSCVYYWLTNVAASGTFVKDPTMTSWAVSTPTLPGDIPLGWTIQNA